MQKTLSFKDKIGILDPTGSKKNPLTDEDYSPEYKKYAKIWSKFPAYEKASDIISSIQENQITMIISGTGSGKSVLIPKFALHYTGYLGKIGMTLPKKVITESAASFAALTLDVKLGNEMGYIYKGSPKSMANENNKMVYMTDGVLIMKFIRDPTLSEFQVIIIDEAHERKIQIDLIMLFLKNLVLSGKRPDLKIIIMSATIDGAKYRKYFETKSFNIVNISGQPNHEINTIFLKEPSKSYLNDGLKLIDKIVDSGNNLDTLFFITASSEAFQLCTNLRIKHPRVYCIEVYGEMDDSLKEFAQSRDKFLELGNYDQKVVMATNVAESSLTIDGLKIVIDSCYELYSYFDPKYGAKILEKRLITQAQALQRRGRVGRTEPGTCYHLLTQQQFNNLEKYPSPDILKQDITMDFLKIINQSRDKNLKSGIDMMNQLMDIPKSEYIEYSIKLFHEYSLINDVGDITTIANDILNFSSEPINRSLFLIYSYKLFCAKEASIIISMIDATSGKISNLFHKSDSICQSRPDKISTNSLLKKMIHKSGDHLTYLNIYQEYINQPDKVSWCRKYGIRSSIFKKVLSDSKKYYYKISDLVRSKQISPSRINNINSEKRIIDALKMSHKHQVAKK